MLLYTCDLNYSQTAVKSYAIVKKKHTHSNQSDLRIQQHCERSSKTRDALIRCWLEMLEQIGSDTFSHPIH